MGGHVGTARGQDGEGRRGAIPERREHGVHGTVPPIDRKDGGVSGQERLQGPRQIRRRSGNLLMHGRKATKTLDERGLPRVTTASGVTEDSNAIQLVGLSPMTLTTPLVLPAAPRESSIKLAHLSDPHLSTLSDIGPLTLRDQRLLGWLSWRRKRRLVHQRPTLDAVVSAARGEAPEHWCITGDLTHIGHEHELSEALAWLQSLGDGDRVSVIPGNHDVYIPSCSEALLTRLWAPYLPDPEGPWPRLQLRGAVALITVNSGHAAPPAFATGGLGSAQREHLGALLRATGAAGYARVLMIHHAPGPGMDKWRKRLVDARALASLLAATGAELILHGHCHESLSRSLPGPQGPIPVLSAPSASATGERGCRTAGYNHLAVTVRETEIHLAGFGFRLGDAPNWRLETRLKRPGVTP